MLSCEVVPLRGPELEEMSVDTSLMLGNTGTLPVNADSLTAHLCLWRDVPVVPALPELFEGPCTLADTAKDLLGCNSNFVHDGFDFQR